MTTALTQTQQNPKTASATRLGGDCCAKCAGEGLAWRLGLCVLEHRRFEAVTLQQLVELGPVALGERRGLGYVAAGDLEQPYEVVALELLARFLEWREHPGVLARSEERRVGKECRSRWS